ncbi:UNVERIFIED_CONTAM: Tryptophan--tRNA ligase, mitochondrial [Siphonaria sp. JEL0065]|nr:Tryptophan--tRNA ligase, mitochondrial [Siphonaria sp. JEL0065]
MAGRTVLSGIQPTGGVPHLGNYLGALANWVNLQPTAANPNDKVFYSIVDLHAITQPQDPATLRKNTKDMAISLLAVGIDPEKSVLFRQSRVHCHSELAWLLFCRTPVGWLARMHQWKTKLEAIQQQQGLNADGGVSGTLAENTMALINGSTGSDSNVVPESVSSATNTTGPCLGLLAYPVLQAADILLYRATEVPIGEDQIQHMNLTSDIAKSFNSQYKKAVFPIPKGVYASATAKKIMSLRTPTSKMSKSDPSDQSRININDTPTEILSKIKKATMDSTRGVSYDPINRPGVANLLRIHAAITALKEPGSTESTPEGVARAFESYDNAQLKKAVGERVVEGLSGVRERMERLKKESGYVEEVLRKGEEKALVVAEKTMRDVKKVIGLAV